MKRAGTCERSWQAEAIEDGRLDGPTRLSFEKHARACAACSKELATLAQVRETMQQIPPLSSTPLEHHRRRADLLRQANTAAKERRRGTLARRAVWLAAALALGAILAIHPLLRRLHEPSSAADSALGAPTFDVNEVEAAQWSSQIVGAEVHARLVAGSASFHVERIRLGQRFLLQVPDGQIEVHGTRFRVEIRDGATTRVVVTEGVVALRLRGEPERLLIAGEIWDTATARESGGGALAQPPSPSRPAGTARDAFTLAVTAFRNGNYRRAEQWFDRFLDESPHDGRVEDVWFMKAVARSRAGDVGGAAEIAQIYLKRFPNGLRRIEAEKLAAASRH